MVFFFFLSVRRELGQRSLGTLGPACSLPTCPSPYARTARAPPPTLCGVRELGLQGRKALLPPSCPNFSAGWGLHTRTPFFLVHLFHWYVYNPKPCQGLYVLQENSSLILNRPQILPGILGQKPFPGALNFPVEKQYRGEVSPPLT